MELHYVVDPNRNGAPLVFRTADEAAAYVGTHPGAETIDSNRVDPALREADAARFAG